jgi:hypothetical protein
MHRHLTMDRLSAALIAAFAVLCVGLAWSSPAAQFQKSVQQVDGAGHSFKALAVVASVVETSASTSSPGGGDGNAALLPELVQLVLSKAGTAPVGFEYAATAFPAAIRARPRAPPVSVRA